MLKFNVNYRTKLIQWHIYCIVICFFFVFSKTSVAENIISNLSHEKLEKKYDQLYYGVCKTKNESINMKELLYLKNDEIKFPSKNMTLKIKGEAIRFELYNKVGEVTKTLITDLGADLAERYNKDDIDINIEFIFLNKNPAIYWRETYQHQIYRLGIYTIQDNRIEFYCDGVGGVSKSH